MNAPAALVDIINQSVDLVRWQHYNDMTEELLDRLARDAIPSTREAAATLGFFSATVEISIDRKKKPIAVVLDVVTGAPTRVTGVSIVVGGPAETEVPAGTETVARLQREWLLPKGDVFTQAGWDNAKTQALGTLVGSPFAAARLTSHRGVDRP